LHYRYDHYYNFSFADTDIVSVLRQVVIDIIDFSACSRMWFYRLTANMMCAGSVGGKSSCEGDSGGPLVCKQGDKWLQYGIASHSNEDCASPTYPAVFANVVNLLPWIEQKTGGRYIAAYLPYPMIVYVIYLFAPQ